MVKGVGSACLLAGHHVARRVKDLLAAYCAETLLVRAAMAVLRLILGHARLAVFAFSLVRLKSVLRAPWSGEKLVLADLAGTLLDTAGAGLEGIWSSKLG